MCCQFKISQQSLSKQFIHQMKELSKLFKNMGKNYGLPYGYKLITHNTLQNNACFTIFGQFRCYLLLKIKHSSLRMVNHTNQLQLTLFLEMYLPPIVVALPRRVKHFRWTFRCKSSSKEQIGVELRRSRSITNGLLCQLLVKNSLM